MTEKEFYDEVLAIAQKVHRYSSFASLQTDLLRLCRLYAPADDKESEGIADKELEQS